jgi:hypothetical protein
MKTFCSNWYKIISNLVYYICPEYMWGYLFVLDIDLPCSDHISSHFFLLWTNFHIIIIAATNHKVAGSISDEVIF